MSRESGSEHTQRTVAELLAQYGGSPDGAPRRRRRRAADDDDQPTTAPQQIIERVLSDSGRILPIRDEPADQPPAQQAPPPPPPGPPAGGPPRPAPVQAPGTGFQPKPPPPPQVRRPNPAEETRVDPMRPDPGALQSRLGGEAPSRSDLPRPGENSRTNIVRPTVAPPGPPPGAPPAVEQPSRSDLPRPGENSRTNIVRPPAPPAAAPPREAMTEQLPRIPAKAPVDQIASLETESVLIVPPAPPSLPPPLPDQSAEDWFGDDDDPQMVQMEHTAAHPGPYVDEDEDDYADNYTPNYAGPGEDYLADGEEPAGLSDGDEIEDDDEDREPRSAGKEWLVMIGQLAVGVLGGAALWLAFNYLWRAVPAAALVVALAVTVGLVLLVRKIRRADDLQTTILAVLVGLIVTVSPAAMLLVKS